MEGLNIHGFTNKRKLAQIHINIRCPYSSNLSLTLPEEQCLKPLNDHVLYSQGLHFQENYESLNESV